MSPEQVVAASGNKAQETSPEERVKMKTYRSKAANGPTLKAPCIVDGFSFTAFFFFRPQQGLHKVSLHLDEASQGAELLTKLRSRFGEPLKDIENPSWILVTWRNNSDTLEYLAIGTLSAKLTYERRGPETASSP
jgi:hypothetical protein